MRTTDITRAASLLFIIQAHAADFASVTCTPRTGAAMEKSVCALVAKQIKTYKPTVASNRTLSKTEIEFAVWTEGGSVTLTSVLVKDPNGKNSVKTIFAPPVGVEVATGQTLAALGKILKTPVTVQSVGWIVTYPE